MNKIFLYFFGCLLLTVKAPAQTIKVADSMRLLINRSKQDSVRVDLYYKYGELFEISNPDSAVYYYKKAKQLSERIGFKQGIRSFTSYYIVVLNNQGKFREALDLCREAVVQYEKEGNKLNLAGAYINVGSEWQYLSDFEQASVYYLKALKLADELQHQKYRRVCNNNLASVFNSLQQYEKGRGYAAASLNIAKEIEDDYAVASSTINIATSDFYLKKYKESLALYGEVQLLGNKMNDDIIRMDGWLGIADNNRELKNYSEAVRYYKQVISFSEQNKMPEYEMYAHMGIADTYVRQKKPAEAEPFVQKGIIIAQQLGTKLELRDLYLRASEVYELKQDFRISLEYQNKFRLLNDSVYSEKNSSTINQLEAKYEFEKKEAQIKQLETDKQLQQLNIRQKNIFNYIFAGSTVALLIISLLSYRTYTQKQKLQQQKIAELEKEKQLLAAEAVLKGQEQERIRLAKDLHDGLGGMLSGIKYSFNTMKGNLVLTPDNAHAFDRSMDMLDSSIKELRIVAHNLMPENLVKFGLSTALKDFCSDITASGVLKVSYHSFGMEVLRMNQNTEVILYRIIQELINNAIKHAAAKEAIVQLQYQNNQLQVTVEDDGKGFNVNSIDTVKGIGWSNIKNRVEYLKGTVNIVSEINRGTSVNIEINI